MNRSPVPVLPDRVRSVAAVDKLGHESLFRVSGGARRVLGSAPFHALETAIGRCARVALGASSVRDTGAPDWDSH